MLGILVQTGVTPKTRQSGKSAASQKPPKPPKIPPLLSPWFDVDAAVAAYCRKRKRKIPTRLEDTLEFHIKAMDLWLEELKAKRIPQALA